MEPGPYYTDYYTNALSKRGVHSSGGSVTHVGEYVRVDVKSEANVGVAQKLLDVLGASLAETG